MNHGALLPRSSYRAGIITTQLQATFFAAIRSTRILRILLERRFIAHVYLPRQLVHMD